MAQKKLLLLIGLIVGFSFNAMAEEKFKFNQSDIDFATNLYKTSRKIAGDAIKEKWIELQKIQQKNLEDSSDQMDEAFDTDMGLENSYSFSVFVSNSMGDTLLKHYLKQAKKYNAVLIFNGLPKGSWRELSNLVYEVTGGSAEEASILLDDISFAKYGITSVPSFVLNVEESIFEEDIFDKNRVIEFDKVSGNIGIKRALEVMEEKGDLSHFATEILENSRSKK